MNATRTCLTCAALLPDSEGPGRPRLFCNELCRKRRPARNYVCGDCPAGTVHQVTSGQPGVLPSRCPAHTSAFRLAAHAAYFERARIDRERFSLWTRLEDVDATVERLDTDAMRARWWAAAADTQLLSITPATDPFILFESLAQAFRNVSNRLVTAAAAAYLLSERAEELLEVFESEGVHVADQIVDEAREILHALAVAGTDALNDFTRLRSRFRDAGGVLPVPKGEGVYR